MPYVDENAREDLVLAKPRTPGQLNYLLTLEAISYVQDRGLSYSTINDVVGALELAKQEFVRRVVTPYEDSKIVENGDVYPTSLITALEPASPFLDRQHEVARQWAMLGYDE